MKFFVGIHQPCDAHQVEHACISINRLLTRVSPFAPPRAGWIMDSGAFTEISSHGRYRTEVEVYARQAARWATNGRLMAVVAQDFMCEPFILAKTGLSVADHQRLTIERYDALRCCWSTIGRSTVPIMPVLQGWLVADYLAHLRAYGPRLEPGMWVGVGSVCKRQGSVLLVEDILMALRAARPDLRFHGFGVKSTALRSPTVRDLLFSADSMAWSFAARREGRNRNSVVEAIAFTAKIDAPLVGAQQLRLI